MVGRAREERTSTFGGIKKGKTENKIHPLVSHHVKGFSISKFSKALSAWACVEYINISIYVLRLLKSMVFHGLFFACFLCVICPRFTHSHPHAYTHIHKYLISTSPSSYRLFRRTCLQINFSQIEFFVVPSRTKSICFFIFLLYWNRSERENSSGVLAGTRKSDGDSL